VRSPEPAVTGVS